MPEFKKDDIVEARDGLKSLIIVKVINPTRTVMGIPLPGIECRIIHSFVKIKKPGDIFFIDPTDGDWKLYEYGVGDEVELDNGIKDILIHECEGDSCCGWVMKYNVRCCTQARFTLIKSARCIDVEIDAPKRTEVEIIELNGVLNKLKKIESDLEDIGPMHEEAFECLGKIIKEIENDIRSYQATKH